MEKQICLLFCTVSAYLVYESIYTRLPKQAFHLFDFLLGILFPTDSTKLQRYYFLLMRPFCFQNVNAMEESHETKKLGISKTVVFSVVLIMLQKFRKKSSGRT